MSQDEISAERQKQNVIQVTILRSEPAYTYDTKGLVQARELLFCGQKQKPAALEERQADLKENRTGRVLSHRFAAHGLKVNWLELRSASMRTCAPCRISPSRILMASGSCTMRCSARFRGRAPYAGSEPAARTSCRAGSVSSSEICRSSSSFWISRHPQIENRAQLRIAQRTEDHHVIHAVEELRPEVLAQHPHHALARHVEVVLGLQRLAGEHGRAQVRRHDQHRVLEVHGAALRVGQPAVVHDLQQHVEHVGMRLLDFVEQDDGSTAGDAPLRSTGRLRRSRCIPEARRSAEPRRASPCTRSCRCAPWPARRRRGTRPARARFPFCPRPSVQEK